MSKVLASHMLQGNFGTEKVTSLELKANLIEPSAFLPQKNACHVEREKNNEVKATSENVMDFSDSHKTKRKTVISCIGMMISMTNFSSLCINMNTIITTICSSSEPQPILRQYSILLISSIVPIGYIGMRVSVGCLYFIGIPTASLRGSSIALLILLPILGMGTSCPRVT
jgi:hypothetical protein